jgi:hypothetical protein
MNLLGLLSQLGHAIVSLGLGGPGDGKGQGAIPCPEVRATADAHTLVEVTAECHTVVRVTTDC